MREWFVRGCLTVFSVLLVSVGAEMTTRFQYFGLSGVVFFWRYSPRLLGSSGFLAPSDNPRIRWLPRAGAKGYLNGVWVEVSSQGLRDREYSLSKPPDTFRIAVLGDSFTFGFGVPLESTYAKRLESRLNAEWESPRFEVINFSCGGHGTIDEVELLKVKALSFHPDLVILGFNLNDLYGNLDFLEGKLKKENPQILPKHPLKRIKQAVYYFLINESFFFRFLTQRQARGAARQELSQPKLVQRLEANPEAWEVLDQQFAELARIRRSHKLFVLVLILHDLELLDKRYPFRPIHQRVAEVARKHGLLVLDFFPYLEGKEASQLWIYPTDAHPNAYAHQIYADAIYQKLVREVFPSVGLAEPRERERMTAAVK